MLRSSRRRAAYRRKIFLEPMTPAFSRESPACASVAPGGTTTRTGRPVDPALHATASASSVERATTRALVRPVLDVMSIRISLREPERVLQQHRRGEGIHVPFASTCGTAPAIGHLVDGTKRPCRGEPFVHQLNAKTRAPRQL